MRGIDKLLGYMSENLIDAVLVYDELNCRYITDYSFSDGAVLVLPYATYLITDFRYFEEARAAVSSEITVVMPENQREFIIDILASNGVKKIGFEPVVTYGKYMSLQRVYSEFTLVSIGDIFEQIRSVKDKEELERMMAAQGIADRAFKHLLGVIEPEMTETEVALELEFFMRRNGAEDVSFETIAVSGEASALPHGKPRNVRLKRGFLTLDFGCKYKGYCSDMTRTLSVGRATDEMKKIYDTVLTAQLAALEAVRVGADCAACDAIARNIIDNAGYKGCFGHSLGHGVGLYIHEKPNLSQRSSGIILTEGNVVTVEPGIYVSGLGGVRIEDTVALTNEGIINFATSPKELIELFA